MNSGARYLVVAPQGLGDSLEATPIVRALRAHDAAARIDVAVTRPGPRLLFAGLEGYVDETIYLPFWESGARRFLGALAATRGGRRYDASFLAYPSARPAYEVLLLAYPSRRRYAHRHRERMLLDLPFARATLVDVRLAHNVERNRDLLRAAGIAPGSEMGYLAPASWNAGEPRAPQRVAVHVGTVAHDGMAERRWPLARFTELCRRLVAAGADVRLIVGPEEREESALLLRAAPGVAAFEGALPDVARFLSTCALVVANDSGIAHLAAAVGTPVVALFGPTPVEHAPFSAEAIALRPSACPPCFDVRTPVARCVRNIGFACLDELTVDLVERTALERIAPQRANAR